ncbi:glycosyltransferase involved in cell wall biosynthesis [Arcticibacter tournemirensis]|uniref:Glycosyltransferase n=1 Tax=Arcticibacter tournemirensis TaxID=699437 RepID=A0A5M9HE81_9SPHI|nr:glycosyltransferase family 2 protein [Arcticibacter tournemirensis]KAA8484635.1 glycosyltransferase [Arcticibacter tournemirensis]TQM47076.1 glycosyltransferase involved in cell wall biosynthesis [Arcticibacter tournemirensis]
MLPKISIVTPSYNQGQFLEDTIRSVLSQGYPNLEYIIIDGGSTDNSVEIIKKYEEHLTYWISEADGGLYHALQKGFERSTGDIMAWINSDDMYHKVALFTAAKIFLQFPDVKWIMGNNTFYNEDGHPFTFDKEPYEQRWSKWRMYLYKGKFIQQESVFWRRDLWNKAGAFIDCNYSLAADFDLWLRFFRHEKLYTTSFMLGGFRFRRENQKSNQQRGEYLDEVRVLLRREKEANGDSARIMYCSVLLYLVRLIPIESLRAKATLKVLKLPRKIVFSLTHGFAFSKR